MKSAPFEYVAPSTISGVLEILGQNDPDEVKLMAGGQSLMPLLNMRLSRPALVLDLGRVADLDFIRETDQGVVIGAMTTKRAVEDSELILREHPLFWESTVAIGHPPIRNRGTVGGSMAQADPASEYPAVALVLEAELVAVSARGERTIPADDFFVTYLTTCLEPDEVLTEIRIPRLAPRTGWAFQEVARRHGDFAIVGATATLGLEAGVAVEPRIAVFGAGDRALRFPSAESLLAGQPATDEVIDEVAAQVAAAVEDPLDDAHASADYRRHLAGVLVGRVLREAAVRAAEASTGA
ncbi:MAG: xanthine dehydrogenase family protein subunit M [Myxococcota bacterium]|jgi:CO/xanthine dehydrogenase FAD-binding subunit|nr:xanthine dehydrogenase family protein subunit M [Myxococcota bacterium]